MSEPLSFPIHPMPHGAHQPDAHAERWLAETRRLAARPPSRSRFALKRRPRSCA